MSMAGEGVSMAEEGTGVRDTLFTTATDRADFEHFTRRLIGLARRHLDVRLQHKVDPEDVVQSAYKSFLLRYGEPDFSEQGLDSLWSLLTLITVRKCADRARYYKAGCRNVAREAQVAQSSDWRAAIAREPTPEHAAVMVETVEGLLAKLPTGERPVIELSLQGYSTQEVSERLGRAERSVRRLRQRLKCQLEQLQIDNVH
jgi:RNA polymerase sigma-70 factor (ECF subfamily)